jgi:hypothetical protein
MLNKPSTLLPSALKPTALFESPSTLLKSALAPTAVLEFPRLAPDESLWARAASPMAVLDGKVFFRSPTAGQRYSEFAKSFENSDKEIDAARKEWFNIKTNIRKLSQ